ncbi:hypothetical protein [Wohlfahrtiimonas chitiniclastica]|uniref:hypothetical protein n=1 Tax=Wohlfahrtiimonas chitiniclastica TaxID=400946 RepID=UPI0007B69ABB|nr:hypothetical protein [Wohlfahrtiimonas chitiniclastica]KZX37236.1 hypothetical protein A6V30_10140 [Wohlfahrtiimonas chitiniclastica]KZX37256.1 hypothetical protein A6V30_10245 [Wohlfahrtiimonas chitiniclastica]
MNSYDEIKKLALELSYRDKLRLAQLLIQTGRKEEEEQYVEKVKEEENISLEYICERLLKSRPSKLKTLENFIDAMFQFKGSISEEEKKSVISQLQNKQFLKIQNNKVIYLST